MKSDDKLKDAIAIMDGWLEYISYQRRIPGMSVGLIVGESLVYNKDFGFKNIEKNIPTTKNTSYRIASISKLFTSVAIMQLAEKGKLHIDDKVSAHLEWFKSKNDSNLKKITIRHLLVHGSGLTRESGANYWVDDKFPDSESIKKYILTKPTVLKPMKQFKYSNLGFGILGLIIEKVSGMPYDEYVTENIINTLDMKNTFPDITRDSIKNLAKGYSRDFPNFKRYAFNNVKTNNLAPATGFQSTVEDLSKLILEIFSESKNDKNSILKRSSRKEMMRDQWGKNSPVKWGLGVQLTLTKDRIIYGHAGGFQGYITTIGYSPKDKIGMIILTNSIDGIAPLLLNSSLNILYNVMKKYDSFKSKKNTKNIPLEKYVGRYYSRWGAFEVRKINNVLILYDSPVLDPLSEPTVLEHKAGDVFTIVKGSPFGSYGEDVTFKFKNGKVSTVIVGSTENKPFRIKR